MSSSLRAAAKLCRVSVGLCACFLAGSSAGCGSGEPFSYVKVYGKVSYDDGTPIKAPEEIKVKFISENAPAVDEKTHARMAGALLNPDGRFDTVTTHTFGDGILPGKHKVLVFVVDDRNQPIEGFVPPEYGDPAKTPIEVDTAKLPWEIKVKKPAGGASRSAGSR